jgi:molybdate transport system substrate-binding protein
VLRFLAATLAALLAGLAPAAALAAPGIAAASDLRFALDEIAGQFTRETGGAVRLTYGSSGNFRRQIAEGAPFELFLSADETYVLALAKEGRLADEGVPYAVGRLVLFAPAGSPVDPAKGMAHLADLARAGRIDKLAIANPEHAPYGRAAREALVKAGAWEALKGRVVLGENVSQAAQFATSGNAAAGIFAYSLTFSPAVSGSGRFALVPESMHAPIRQRMALVKGAGEEARAFYRFLQTPQARAVLSRYGFTLPGP